MVRAGYNNQSPHKDRDKRMCAPAPEYYSLRSFEIKLLTALSICKSSVMENTIFNFDENIIMKSCTQTRNPPTNGASMPCNDNKCKYTA